MRSQPNQTSPEYNQPLKTKTQHPICEVWSIIASKNNVPVISKLRLSHHIYCLNDRKINLINNTHVIYSIYNFVYASYWGNIGHWNSHNQSQLGKFWSRGVQFRQTFPLTQFLTNYQATSSKEGILNSKFCRRNTPKSKKYIHKNEEHKLF